MLMTNRMLVETKRRLTKLQRSQTPRTPPQAQRLFLLFQSFRSTAKRSLLSRRPSRSLRSSTCSTSRRRQTLLLRVRATTISRKSWRSTTTRSRRAGKSRRKRRATRSQSSQVRRSSPEARTCLRVANQIRGSGSYTWYVCMRLFFSVKVCTLLSRLLTSPLVGVLCHCRQSRVPLAGLSSTLDESCSGYWTRRRCRLGSAAATNMANTTCNPRECKASSSFLHHSPAFSVYD